MKAKYLTLIGLSLILFSCGSNNTTTVNQTETMATVENDLVLDIIDGKSAIDLNKFTWINQPKEFSIDGDNIVITTEQKTDLWQHTLNGADLSNAPILATLTDQQNFTFTVKTEFSDASTMYDQCGPIVYMDRDNWLKASVENAGDEGYLGSVNNMEGRSDWATSNISGEIKTVWYKVVRSGCDVVISSSFDGQNYNILRFTHINKAEGAVCIGVYACSPGDGASFKAKFSDMSFEKGGSF